MTGCIGNMMRSPFQPLAELVDAAAEKWLAVEDASAEQQQLVYEEITASFSLLDRDELTFHGKRFLLSLYKDPQSDPGKKLCIDVHEIVQSG